jgi:hypothetical protein
VANLKPQTASVDFANNLRQFVKRKLGWNAKYSGGRLQSQPLLGCFL